MGEITVEIRLISWEFRPIFSPPHAQGIDGLPSIQVDSTTDSKASK
jgi:hypothetical protein